MHRAEVSSLRGRLLPKYIAKRAIGDMGSMILP